MTSPPVGWKWRLFNVVNIFNINEMHSQKWLQMVTCHHKKQIYIKEGKKPVMENTLLECSGGGHCVKNKKHGIYFSFPIYFNLVSGVR